MAAYVVVDIEVLEPVEYEEYKNLAAPSVTAYGGRYVVRGGLTEVLEATGFPTGWWCSSSPPWPRLKPGGRRPSTASPR